MNAWFQEPTKVLIADDDPDLLNLVTIAFRGAGFETQCVASGAAALHAFGREAFSLLVLDINMPAPNGLEVCGLVRQTSNVPILVLSARDQEQDMLQALDAGADAYVSKPFRPRTLIARAQALLRRAELFDSPNKHADKFKLDPNESLLRHPGGEIRLTKIEMRVLRLLMLNAGRTVTAGELTTEVWNSYRTANRNMLKQVVFRLRRKLAISEDVKRALRSSAGGYMWTEKNASAELDIDDADSVVTS